GVLDVFFNGSKAAGFAFMAFNLLCAPCFAAMGAIKREMNSSRWTIFAISYMCLFAYGTGLVIYQIGSALNGEIHVAGLIAAICVILFVCYMLLRPYKEAERLTKEVRVSC
ncbi:MAG: ferrous iron transporter B, partial [Erysipelotrichaceae bacterium]|nr:ferrous iron transporter B [Erysipelotrichaceae bacterium]